MLRKFRGAARLAWRGVNRRLLHHLDLSLAWVGSPIFEHAPVFVIGAPRSGSTLVTQVLTNALDIGYFSNAHCRYFGAPALAERILRPLAKAEPSGYRSEFGDTAGPSAPSECGEYWYRFFRKRPTYVANGDVGWREMSELRRSLAAFVHAIDRPLLIKNMYCAMRLQPIVAALPEALFIVMGRDEVDNGQSLLSVRMSIHGSYERWWSMEPPDTDVLRKLPVHAQVVEQIRSIHRVIESDFTLSGIDRNRVHHIAYEAFCDDVHGAVEAVKAFLGSNGVKVVERYPVPEVFHRRARECRIDSALFERLVEYCDAKR